MNRFFTGRFNGTFASGEPFQLNPSTGDCRICGTMASLSGLEQAENQNNAFFKKMALARMKMLYSTLFALPGIPLLYAGDEQAVFNDYSYRNDSSKKEDSRWVHRIKRDDSKQTESQKAFSEHLKKIISIRGKEKMLGGNDIFFYDVQDSHVFAFRRGTVHVIANFSENKADFKIDAWSKDSTDLLSGKTFSNYDVQTLEPYEVRWLKENI